MLGVNSPRAHHTTEQHNRREVTDRTVSVLNIAEQTRWRIVSGHSYKSTVWHKHGRYSTNCEITPLPVAQMKTAGHNAGEKRSVIGTVQYDGKKREAGSIISNNERSLQVGYNDVGGATRRRTVRSTTSIKTIAQSQSESKKPSNKAKIKAKTIGQNQNKSKHL